MTATIQSLTPTDSSTSTTDVASPPASLANGDLMIGIHSTYNLENVAHTHSPPSGWNLIQSETPLARSRMSVFEKIAASESGNYTFTDSQTVDHIVNILRITGHKATGYIHQSAKAPFVTQTNFICPEVTTTLDDCLILYICHWNGSGTLSSAPAGTTSRIDHAFTGETTHRLFCYSKTLATAGPSGTGTFVRSAAANGIGITIAIPPSVGNRRRRQIILGIP